MYKTISLLTLKYLKWTKLLNYNTVTSSLHITMTFKLLRILFKIGNCLAITPKNFKLRKPTILEKILGCFMLIFQTVTAITSVAYKLPQYSQYIYIKLTVYVILDVSLYLFSVTAVLSGLFKRNQWYKLVKNLMLTGKDPTTGHKKYFGFIVVNVIFLAMMVYLNVVFGTDFVKRFTLNFFKLYVQFFINYLVYAILQILKMRYRSLAQSLENEANIRDTTLKRVSYDYILLKESVSIFNNIFGWLILFNTIHSSLQIVVYPSDTFLSSRIEWILADIFVLIIFCGGIVITIISCDLVLSESEKILSISLKHLEASPDNRNLLKFIEMALANFPKFSAARFFSISRTTILRILNATVTFLIVVIQFQINVQKL
ncbi:gustatory receptor 66 [Tribolium castaneum]|uniref:Gustatory receptor n=1 Tax=Tribolium castaneum TaxID=7070 RepID=D6WC25_TRICA|nr:gustatory receptor 66 [Tribolium castaneum]